MLVATTSTGRAEQALALQNVSIAFGGLQVLHNVAFEVRPGEVVGLIGPNGAGKSALLNCISGAYKPDVKSRILLGGRRLDLMTAVERRRTGVCRTYQHANLVDELTVLDNVLLGLAAEFRGHLLYSLARPRLVLNQESYLKKRAEEMLDMCGVLDLRNVLADTLPLGIRRRVDLARALVGAPSILLLDEPGSGLSHDERKLIPELIAVSRRSSRPAVIWIEHDVALVTSTADRTIVLRGGKVVCDERMSAGQPARDRAVDAYLTQT